MYVETDIKEFQEIKPADYHSTMEPLSPQDPKNIGPWKLLNRIGAGGMGVVFYAEQKTKRVALKVVRNSFLDSPELKSRL